MMTRRTKQNKEALVFTGLFSNYTGLKKYFFSYIYRILKRFKFYKALKYFSRYIINLNLNREDEICFLVWSCYANDVKNFLGDYLRSEYTNCKIVCRFTDIIEKMKYSNFNDYRDSFDYLFTYDEIESKKYNIDYLPLWYDRCAFESTEDECDVFFIGRGKDRLQDIFDAFAFLDSKGVNCKFYLVNVPINERKYEDRIIYGDYLPYSKALGMVMKAKCLLEIIQSGSNSETLRVFESITYGKKLLTNNVHLMSRDYYSPVNIQCYSKVSDIDVNFIFSEPQVANYDSQFVDRLKPIYTFKFIDSKL